MAKGEEEGTVMEKRAKPCLSPVRKSVRACSQGHAELDGGEGGMMVFNKIACSTASSYPSGSTTGDWGDPDRVEFLDEIERCCYMSKIYR